MDYPKYLNDLIESLKSFPGIGSKSATRMAFQLLKMDQETLLQITRSLENLPESIQYCEKCHNLSESAFCSICQDQTRDQYQICVVSNFQDIYAIEKMRGYQGVYHVLNGDIALSKGIGPDKLNINSLIKRVDDDTNEVIIATNPTIEGETTALYIAKLLEDKSIKTTRIAHGLPIGTNIEIVDELTILKAFEGRKIIDNK